MNALAGPQVDFAFLCDAAAAGEGGKLEAFGIGVDTFAVAELPCLLPLLLVARLSGSGEPAALSLRVIDADGRTVHERKLSSPNIRTEAGHPRKTPVIEHVFLRVAAEGDYRLDLALDGRAVHSLPFWVQRWTQVA